MHFFVAGMEGLKAYKVVKCIKNEPGKFLHRLHVLYMSCICNSKLEQLHAFQEIDLLNIKTIVKSAQLKINFLISQPKHMLWVLKRNVSMRRFF